MAKPTGPLCNLHCAYCFYLSKEELFTHEKRNDFIMTPEVRELFIQQYIQSQPEGVKEVVFGWQGGEPTLLGLDFFRDVIRLQKKYNTRGIEIHNSIQTNGTLLTDEYVRFLKDHGFLVGISIDGPESLHNRYRLDRLGKGSFSQVMKGIEILKKQGAEFNTLTVVQDNNSLYPLEVYDFLAAIGSRYLQFIPIVEPAEPGSRIPVGKRSVRPLEWGKFLTAVLHRWAEKDIGTIFVQHFDVTLGQYAGLPSPICVHGKYCGKAMAIEHDGTIYSCDHFVSPEYRIGSVTQPLAEVIMSDRQIRFGLDKFDTLPQECLECRFLTLCFGECPKNRVIPKSGGMQNWLCEGYRYFYEQSEYLFSAMSQSLRYGEDAGQFRKYMKIPDSILHNIARNDPCPCLSGKKYKHCHGS